MSTPPTFPINYDAIRKALVDQVQLSTKLTCIVAQPETQNADRPAKPYATLQFLRPAIKVGDDASRQVPDISGNPTSVWNVGGQRKLVVDFNFYGRSHEEAYDYGALWQASLELETVQTALRTAGIAVWLNAGPLRDLSLLLNTGFEGRAQLEVSFGVASNVTEDRSYIERIDITGPVTTDQDQPEAIAFTVNAP